MFRLTVPNMEKSTFESYYYGWGEIESVTVGTVPARDGGLTFTYVVNYGEDKYRADYQAGRFASGLYFAKVEEV